MSCSKMLGIRGSFADKTLLQHEQGLCAFRTGVLRSVQAPRRLSRCEAVDGLPDVGESIGLDHDGSVLAREDLVQERSAVLPTRDAVSTPNGDVKYLHSELEPALQHPTHIQCLMITCSHTML